MFYVEATWEPFILPNIENDRLSWAEIEIASSHRIPDIFQSDKNDQ